MGLGQLRTRGRVGYAALSDYRRTYPKMASKWAFAGSNVFGRSLAYAVSRQRNSKLQPIQNIRFR